MTPEIVGNYGRHVSRMLRPGADLCLRMNKPSETAITTVPSVVQKAFSNVAFEQFRPFVEHQRYTSYMHGRQPIGQA